MRALRKEQAAVFNLTLYTCGEAHIVKRAFGIGACALVGAIALVDQTLYPKFLDPRIRKRLERSQAIT